MNMSLLYTAFRYILYSRINVCAYSVLFRQIMLECCAARNNGGQFHLSVVKPVYATETGIVYDKVCPADRTL